jgi:uncharacterized protein YdeI (YjbR/CyaY-like superfamily)
MKATDRKPRFFATPADFRKWLTKHHVTARELWVGFYKRGTGKPSITWPESVEEALCAGWIDGVRKSINDESYVIRFTPRKATSTWSAVNLKKFQQLIREGRVLPAGLKAHQTRPIKKSGYSYEERYASKLDRASERRFRANAAAWKHFQSQPPWYRQTTIFWVVSAKKEETRQRRLSMLIAFSAKGEPIPGLKRPWKGKH